VVLFRFPLPFFSKSAHNHLQFSVLGNKPVWIYNTLKELPHTALNLSSVAVSHKNGDMDILASAVSHCPTFFFSVFLPCQSKHAYS
jgi:hypothetical protein